MIEREITRRDLLKLGRLAVFSGGIYAITSWIDSLQNTAGVGLWAKKVTVYEGYGLAAIEVNGETGLFMVREENGNSTPLYKVRGGIDFADAVYGLREVDEKGTPLPNKKEEFAIIVVPDRSIDKTGRIIMVGDKVYPLIIPEGMRPKENLNAIFNYASGLSRIVDESSGKEVAYYNPLTGHFLKGGPEDIFEKEN